MSVCEYLVILGRERTTQELRVLWSKRDYKSEDWITAKGQAQYLRRTQTELDLIVITTTRHVNTWIADE